MGPRDIGGCYADEKGRGNGPGRGSCLYKGIEAKEWRPLHTHLRCGRTVVLGRICLGNPTELGERRQMKALISSDEVDVTGESLGSF